MISILKYGQSLSFGENQNILILDNLELNKTIKIKLSEDIKYSSQLVEEDLAFEFIDEEGNSYQLILKDMATLLAQNDGTTLIELILLKDNLEDELIASISDLGNALQASAAGPQEANITSDTYNNPGFNNASENGLENRNYDNSRIGQGNNLPSNAVGNENAQDALSRRNFAPKIDDVDAQIVDEDSTLVFTFNATDRDNDTLTATASSVDGNIEINENVITFTPNENFNGQTTITLSISDGKATTTKNINVIVSDINDEPKLEIVSTLEVNEDGNKTITFIANDVDGTVNTTAVANNGIVVINGNEIKYTPNANFNGSDTITVTTTDDDGASIVKEITVTVNSINDAPIIESQTISVLENGILSGTVIAKDIDLPSGEKLVFSTIDLVDGFSMDQDGNYEFDASDYDYLKDGEEETISINIDVEDELGASSSNIFTIKLTGTNDVPTLEVVSTIVVDEDGSKTITFTANDIDGTVNTTAVANNGAVVINGSNITYTPNENFNGSDIITVTTTDDDGAKVVKTVSVIVNDINDAPTLEVISTITVDEDGSKTITFTVNDVDGTINTTAVANNGTVVINGNEIKYTPNENYNGSDIITVTTTDDDGAKVVKTIAVTVNDVNDAPTLEVVSTIVVDEDGSKTITFTANDIDGTVTTTAVAANGVVVINGSEISYTPNENFNGSDTITLTIIDDDGDKILKTVSVTVNSVNDVPVIKSISTQTVAEDNIKIVVIDVDDVDGDDLTKTVNATNGTAVINSDGNIEFTPDTNFNGVSVVTLAVNDGITTTTQTFNINVIAVNDVPIGNDDFGFKVNENSTSLEIDVLSNDTDVEDSPLSIDSFTQPLKGSIQLNSTGDKLEFIPGNDFDYLEKDEEATVAFTYSVSDGELTSDATVVLTVKGTNDAPEITAKDPILVLESDLDDATKGVLETIVTDADGIISLSISTSNSTIVNLFEQFDVSGIVNNTLLELLNIPASNVSIAVDKSVEGSVTINTDISGLPSNPFETAITQENLKLVILDKLGTAFNLPLENAVYSNSIEITDLDNIEDVTLSLGQLSVTLTTTSKLLISVFEQISGISSTNRESIQSLLTDILSGDIELTTNESKSVTLPSSVVNLLETAGLINVVIGDVILNNDGTTASVDYQIVSPIFNMMKNSDTMQVSFEYTVGDEIASVKSTETVSIQGTNDTPVAIEDTVSGEIANTATSYEGALPGTYIYKMFKTVNDNIDTDAGVAGVVNIDELQEALLNSVLGEDIDVSVNDIEAFALYQLITDFELSLDSTIKEISDIIETNTGDNSNRVALEAKVQKVLLDYAQAANPTQQSNLLTQFSLDLTALYGVPVILNPIEFNSISSSVASFATEATNFPTTFTQELLSIIGINQSDYDISEYTAKFGPIQTLASGLIFSATDSNFDLGVAIQGLMREIDNQFTLTAEQQIEAKYLVELIANASSLTSLATIDPQSLINVDALLSNLGIDLNNLDFNEILSTVTTDLSDFAKSITFTDLINDPNGVTTFVQDLLDQAFESIDNVLDDVLNNTTTEQLHIAINQTLTDAIIDELGEPSLESLIVQTVDRLTGELLADVTIDNLKESALTNILEQLGLDTGLLEKPSRDVIAEDMVQDIYDRLSIDEDFVDNASIYYHLDEVSGITTTVYDENGDVVTGLDLNGKTTVTVNPDGLYTIDNPDFVTISSLWKVEVTFSYQVDDSNGVTTPTNGNEVSVNTDSKEVIVTIDIADIVTNGVASDGYISNATVFADSNENGVWDLGEAKTTTDAKGDFKLVGGSGTLVAYGGTDISTGLEFEGVFTAPSGSTIISPLTTLVDKVSKQLMLDDESLSLEDAVSQAKTLVTSSLSIDSSIDILTFDPLAVISDEDASSVEKETALDVQTVAVQVVNIMSQTAQAVEYETNGETSEEDAALSTVNSIAQIIVRDETIDLTNSSTITEVIESVEENEDITITDQADIIDATLSINQAMDDANSFESLAKIQIVAEEIEEDVRGDGDIENVLTQTEVETQAALKTIGSVNVNQAFANPIIQEEDLEDTPIIDSTYNGTFNSIENAQTYNFTGGLVLTFTNDTNELYKAINAITNLNSTTMSIDNANYDLLSAEGLLSINVNDNGNYSIISNKFTSLDNDDNISIEFDYAGTAEDGTSVTSNVNLTVIGKNFAPSLDISEMNVSILEDETKTISFSASDIDGTVQTVASAKNGSVLVSNGQITYTPNENFNGVDIITVKATDNDGSIVQKTISVEVGDVNDDPTLTINSSLRVDEDSSKAISFTASDLDGKVALVEANASKGSVIVSAGQITYSPNEDYFGADTITVTVTDDDGAKVTKTVAVTVNDVNDLPIIESITQVTILEDEVKEIIFTSSDNDGSIVSNVASALNGKVSVDGNTITYTPNENYFGNDKITLTSTDDDGESTIQTINVSITSVNDLPQLSIASSMTTDEDTVKTISFTANDVEGISSIDATATKGEVDISNGVITYTPNENFHGTDTITVTVEDTDGKIAEKTVTIIVTSVNDAPILEVISPVSMAEDTSKTISFTASDIEGAVTTTVTGEQNGQVVLGDGEFTYTPDANFSGQETLTVTVTDLAGEQVQRTVVINVSDVNEIPTLDVVSTVTMNEDTIKEILFTANDVDGNVRTTATASKGTAQVVDSKIIYTPDADFFGTSIITVTTVDDRGDSVQKTVTVTVNDVNELPTIDVVATASLDEDSSKVITFTASDIDGSIVNTIASATNGTATILGNEITYTPTENYFGDDTITIVTTDDSGETTTKTVEITVNSVNDLPTISDVNVSVQELDGRVEVHSGKLSASDEDEGATHTFEISNVTSSNPLITDFEVIFDESGSYSLVGNFDLLPQNDNTTVISFDYIAIDNENGRSTIETVSIAVVGTNDAPVAKATTYEVDASDTQVSFEGSLPGAKVGLLLNNTTTPDPIRFTNLVSEDIVNNFVVTIASDIDAQTVLNQTFDSLALGNAKILSSLDPLTAPLDVIVKDLLEKRDALPGNIKDTVISTLGGLSEDKLTALDNLIKTFVDSAEASLTNSAADLTEDKEAFALGLFDVYESSVKPEDIIKIAQDIQGLQTAIETKANSLVSDIVTAIETQIGDETKTSDLTTLVTNLISDLENPPFKEASTTEKKTQEDIISEFGNDVFTTFNASVTFEDLEVIKGNFTTLQQNLEQEILVEAGKVVPQIVTAIETQIGDTSKTAELTTKVGQLLADIENPPFKEGTTTPKTSQEILEEFGNDLFTTFNASVTPTDLAAIQVSISPKISTFEADIANAQAALPQNMINAIITIFPAPIDMEALTNAVMNYLLNLKEETPTATETFAQDVVTAYMNAGTFITPIDLQTPTSDINLALAAAGQELLVIDNLTNQLLIDIRNSIEDIIGDTTQTSALDNQIGLLINKTITTEEFINSLFTVYNSSVTPDDLTAIQGNITIIQTDISNAIQSKIDALPASIVTAIEIQIDDFNHTGILTAKVGQLLVDIENPPVDTDTNLPKTQEKIIEEFGLDLFTVFDSSVTPEDLVSIQGSIAAIQATLTGLINSLPSDIIEKIEVQLDNTDNTVELTDTVNQLLADIKNPPFKEGSTTEKKTQEEILAEFSSSLFIIYDASVTAADLLAIESTLQIEVEALQAEVTKFPTTFTKTLLDSLGVDSNNYSFDEYVSKFGSTQTAVTQLMSSALNPGFDLNTAAQDLIQNVIITFGLSIEKIIQDNLPVELTTAAATLISSVSTISEASILTNFTNPVNDLGIDFSNFDFTQFTTIKNSVVSTISALPLQTALVNPDAISSMIQTKLDTSISDLRNEIDSNFTMTQEELNSAIIDFIYSKIEIDFAVQLAEYEAQLINLFGSEISSKTDAMFKDILELYIEQDNIVDIDVIKHSILVSALEQMGLSASLIEEEAREDFANDLTEDIITSLTADSDLTDNAFAYSIAPSTIVETTIIDSLGNETTLAGTNVVVNSDGSYNITNPTFENVDSASDIEVSFQYIMIDKNGTPSNPEEITVSIDKEDIYTADIENIDMSALLSSAISGELDEVNLDSDEHILNNLSITDFISLTDDDNTLRIFGDETDTIRLNASDNWSQQFVKDDLGNSTTPERDEEGFNIYTSTSDESIRLLIEESINVEII